MFTAKSMSALEKQAAASAATLFESTGVLAEVVHSLSSNFQVRLKCSFFPQLLQKHPSVFRFNRSNFRF